LQWPLSQTQGFFYYLFITFNTVKFTINIELLDRDFGSFQMKRKKTHVPCFPDLMLLQGKPALVKVALIVLEKAEEELLMPQESWRIWNTSRLRYQSTACICPTTSSIFRILT